METLLIFEKILLKLCGKICGNSGKILWKFCTNSVETLRDLSEYSIEKSVELLWKLCGNVMEKTGGNYMAMVILWKFCGKFYGTSVSEVPRTERIMGIMNTRSLQ